MGIKNIKDLCGVLETNIKKLPGAEGIEVLSDVLKINKTLMKLDLSGNLIREEGAHTLNQLGSE